MSNQVGEVWAGAPREAQKERGVPEKLIRKASRGNRAALRELCESIARHVTFRVMRKIKRPADVEDVAQEILFRVCEGIRNLKDPRAFGGWLNTIINNETNRYFTQNKKHGVVISMDEYLESIVLEDEDDYLAHDYVIKEEERKAVIAIIDTLPDRQLEAVMLYYYEGMSVTETARAMGVTKQVISIHLARAKEKIRSVLNKDTENIEKTGTSSFAALGIGALISQSLFDEAALMPVLGKASVDSAVAAGIAKAEVVSAAAGSVAVKGLAKWVIGVVAGMALIAAGVSLFYVQEAAESKEVSDLIITSIAPIATQGDIVFSDGETELNTVNPHHAVVWATNDRGDLTAQTWWITQEDTTVLFRGAGASVEDTLITMHKNRNEGVFTLWFEMVDSMGVTYTLQRQFTIQIEGTVQAEGI